MSRRPKIFLHATPASCVFLLLISFNGTVHANIHKCVSSEGIEYSDTHCTMGILVELFPNSRTIDTVEGLSKLELVSLQKLESAYRRTILQSDREKIANKKKFRRTRARERQDRTRACVKANLALERLRLLKRKGYKAKQSHSLDTREKLLNQQKRSNC